MPFLSVAAHQSVVAQLEARLADKDVLIVELRAERDRFRDLLVDALGKKWDAPKPENQAQPLTADAQAEAPGIIKTHWNDSDHEWFGEWCADQLNSGAKPQELETKWKAFAGTKTPLEAMTVG